MKERVLELLEQFNNEFPNGDSYELAQYIYAHASTDAYIEITSAMAK